MQRHWAQITDIVYGTFIMCIVAFVDVIIDKRMAVISMVSDFNSERMNERRKNNQIYYILKWYHTLKFFGGFYIEHKLTKKHNKNKHQWVLSCVEYPNMI